MLAGGIPIGRVWGIQLRLHWSWFFIFALITWALVENYFTTTTNWTLGASVAAGLITSFFFFGSVLFHELMHSRVALNQGLPVKSIVLFALGGVSQIGAEPKSAGNEFRMAFAGPGTSLVLGGIFIGIYFALRDNSQFGYQFGAAIAYWLGYINIALGIFNLVPGFPLDGGRVLRSIIWGINKNLRRSTRIASIVGQAFGYIFILVGVWLFFTGNFLSGVWLAIIGLFLINAAAGSYQQLVSQDMLKGHTASEIMTRECVTVNPDLSVERLVNENILASGRRCFPVVSGDHVEGLVTVDSVKGIPRNQWTNTPVSQAMITLDRVKSVKPDDDLTEVMQLMTENNINQVPVIQDHTIVGMVNRENLLNFINSQRQLRS